MLGDAQHIGEAKKIGKNTLTQTFAELFRAQAEVKVVEEKQDSALLKLKQKDNKGGTG